MSKTIKEERLRWILPIIKKEVKLVDVAKVCPHSKRSLERWLSNHRKYGKNGLEPKSTTPKTSPNETSIRIKERIEQLKKKYDSFLILGKKASSIEVLKYGRLSNFSNVLFIFWNMYYLCPYSRIQKIDCQGLFQIFYHKTH